MKLLQIIPASDNIHKYKAIFLLDSGKKKTVKFGAKGYKDFIQYSKDDKELALERKELYLLRHNSNENWNQPMTPGSLSRHILWSEPTLDESIKKYKAKFNL